MLIMRRYRTHGFSMIEAMVAISLALILTLLAVPSFNKYTQNNKIRGTASAFLSGLTSARAEAISRNQNVEFLLTNSDPVAANVATAVASSNGVNWMVRTLDTSVTPPAQIFIEGRYGVEGSGRQTTVAPSVQINSGGVSSIFFSGLGATNLGAATDIDFTNPSGGACAAAATPGPMRCLRIVITPGGQTRLCDPAATATGDTRSC